MRVLLLVLALLLLTAPVASAGSSKNHPRKYKPKPRHQPVPTYCLGSCGAYKERIVILLLLPYRPVQPTGENRTRTQRVVSRA